MKLWNWLVDFLLLKWLFSHDSGCENTPGPHEYEQQMRYFDEEEDDFDMMDDDF